LGSTSALPCSSTLLPRRLQFTLLRTHAAANASGYQTRLFQVEKSNGPRLSLNDPVPAEERCNRQSSKGTRRPAAGILPPSYLRCMISNAHAAAWHCH
jgi:hypothetical protein